MVSRQRKAQGTEPRNTAVFRQIMSKVQLNSDSEKCVERSPYGALAARAQALSDAKRCACGVEGRNEGHKKETCCLVFSRVTSCTKRIGKVLTSSATAAGR